MTAATKLVDTTRAAHVHHFLTYLKQIEHNPHLKRLEALKSSGGSTAGSASLEELFTREVLCPAIARYFYDVRRLDLDLSDDQIRSGLGTEGYKNLPQFGFTPARRERHLFTKGDIIDNAVPTAWFKDSGKKLPPFQACPDFAIRSPLPFSLVGEVKLFKSGSPKAAVKEIYNAARQAVFYLGAFNGQFDGALLVVADTTPTQAMRQGIEMLEPELVARFGEETGVHLVTLKLT